MIGSKRVAIRIPSYSNFVRTSSRMFTRDVHGVTGDSCPRLPPHTSQSYVNFTLHIR